MGISTAEQFNNVERRRLERPIVTDWTYPTAGDDRTLGILLWDVTLLQIDAVVAGGTPSVTWTIRHDTDRSATGTEVIVGGTVTTSTSGVAITSFDASPLILAADSWLWVEATAVTDCYALTLALRFT